MTDAEFIATIPKMTFEELFALLISEPSFLTDGYYSKLRPPILKRYEELVAQKKVTP